MADTSDDVNTVRRHIALLGGVRKEGKWRAGRSVSHIALIGGAVFDLTGAQLEAEEVTITSIAAVGGAKITVPPGVDVQLNVYSIVGGVQVIAPVSARIDVTGFVPLGGRKYAGPAQAGRNVPSRLRQAIRLVRRNHGDAGLTAAPIGQFRVSRAQREPPCDGAKASLR